MPNIGRDPRPAAWDRAYEGLRIPWRSAGVSTTARELLLRHSSPTGNILEIGCGIGDDATDLARLGFDYVGLDVSRSAIQHAIRNHRLIGAFVHGDFFDWIPESAFRVAYEKGVFHNLRGVRKRNAFIRRLASMLHPNGIWLSVCGAADHRRSDFGHGAIYVRDLIGPAEVYFEVLEVVKAEYGLADKDHEFQAWHVIFKRR